MRERDLVVGAERLVIADPHQVEGGDIRLQRVFGNGPGAAAADIGGGDVEQDGISEPRRKLEQMMWALRVRANGKVDPLVEMDLGGEIDDEVHF